MAVAVQSVVFVDCLLAAVAGTLRQPFHSGLPTCGRPLLHSHHSTASLVFLLHQNGKAESSLPSLMTLTTSWVKPAEQRKEDDGRKEWRIDLWTTNCVFITSSSSSINLYPFPLFLSHCSYSCFYFFPDFYQLPTKCAL
uniref:Putative secreted protein n=1 Tax=Ixodes ricinus TaxID=34613 RepID=A0A6B0UST3_IXORI